MLQPSNVGNSASNEITRFTKVVKKLRQTNPALFWILVFTVITRIGVYLTGQPWNQDVITDTILIGDGAQYHEIAIGFLNGTPLSETK